MRLRRGDCAKGGGRTPKAQTPELVGRGMNCAVLTALPASSLRAALRERPHAALRAAQIIVRSSGPRPRCTQRARGTVTLRANPRPAEVSWPWLSLRGFPGRLRSGQILECRLAGARPALIAARARERERKVSPCCSARRLRCAEADGYRDFPRCLAMSRAKAVSADS